MSSPHPQRRELIDFALTLPEAWEDFPWGESAAKVKKKVFAFFGVEGAGTLKVCVKLPASSAEALELEETEVAGYGLGKSGWVVAEYAPEETADMDRLRDWIVESYCAIAPKKLADEVESG
ncbi:MAG: MmcQ/YjbR family DNA-binding protein [Planctomycetota bacterium]